MNGAVGQDWIVVSTGRCGSTALSDLVHAATDLASLSELTTALQPLPDPRLECDGDATWELVTRPRTFMATLTAARCEPEELLYRFHDGARFTREGGVAPLCVAALPHLVGDDADALLEDLEPGIRTLPRQAVALQLQEVARMIAGQVGKRGLVERSGASSGYLPTLLNAGFFPEARLVHLYRNGLDTALSMMGHSVIRLSHIRYLQIAVFGEDFYAEEVGGFPSTVPSSVAGFIVGKTPVAPDLKRDLEALHPSNFDPAALWRARLPLELFARSWSLMCLSAERLLRTRPVLHLDFDRITSADGPDELAKLGSELGADPGRWEEAVTRTIRGQSQAPQDDSRVLRELRVGSSALDRLLT